MPAAAVPLPPAADDRIAAARLAARRKLEKLSWSADRLRTVLGNKLRDELRRLALLVGLAGAAQIAETLRDWALNRWVSERDEPTREIIRGVVGALDKLDDAFAESAVEAVAS